MDEQQQDWRLQLQPDTRSRMIKKIMDILKRRRPFSSPCVLLELTKIAIRFEEKVYTYGITQWDYLRKISLTMRAMEMRTQNNNNPMPNPRQLHPPNPVDTDDTRWQTQLKVDFRQRIVSKLLVTSMKHKPICDPAEILVAVKVAVTFEENVYTTAANESDYLHKISLKILSMEVNSEYNNVDDDTLPQNAVDTGLNFRSS
ncbi:hypothetical protein ACHQM5_018648 [Ranunculus cassubicifolius]